MKIADLPSAELQRKLKNSGIDLPIGPFVIRVTSKLGRVAYGISLLYSDAEITSHPVADFYVNIYQPPGLRRWYRPQVVFSFDGTMPFKPMPLAQALATLEWGLNWCISSHTNAYLVVHAAAIEKHGRAIIMPAQPGAGKSTLTAALVSRGWRLLSDELTLLTTTDHPQAIPVPKPINLKNASIKVISQFAPETILGPVVYDTAKGSVSHMKTPGDSVQRMREPAEPAFIIFPTFRANAQTSVSQLSKARSFLNIAKQCFNFHILGETGFKTLDKVVTNCQCFEFRYSDLEEAVDFFDNLIDPGEG